MPREQNVIDHASDGKNWIFVEDKLQEEEFMACMRTSV